MEERDTEQLSTITAALIIAKAGETIASTFFPGKYIVYTDGEFKMLIDGVSHSLKTGDEMLLATEMLNKIDNEWTDKRNPPRWFIKVKQ